MNKKEWKEKGKQQDRERLAELTEIFRKYGAENPGSWAHSQLHEGINQLTRFSLLKALTSEVLTEAGFDWIDLFLQRDRKDEGAPLSQLAPALREMKGKGVSKESIIDLVRVIQFETIFHVLSVLEGEINVEVPVTRWGIFEKDENDNPAREICGLHESLLGFDPDGREFRPRG